MQNILNEYKDMVGEYCAINQFVELAKRSLIKEHENEINSIGEFKKLAARYSLSLSCYEAGLMENVVSRSYIVNVYFCFETFLKDLCKQIKKYGLNKYRPKVKEESWLNCALKNIILGSLSEQMKPEIELCEYYRLVRNSAVHDLCNIDSHEKVLQKLMLYPDFRMDAKYKRLLAPNKYDEIIFDDFVMFARSSIDVAVFLFENCKYDYKKIIIDVPAKYKNKWKKWGNNRQRGEKAILSYIRSNYNLNEELSHEIPSLFDLLWLDSSMVEHPPS